MPDIKWSVAVQIAGGPSVARSAALAVDAYDKVEVTVPAGEENLEVQVAPTNAGIRFLMMTATPAGAEALDATYRVNDAAADEHAIDSPLLMLIGAGAVGLMGGVPRSLFLTNNSGTQAVAVEILVGRDPTP